MIVDGVDKEQLHQLLENSIEMEASMNWSKPAKVFEAMGGVCTNHGNIGGCVRIDPCDGIAGSAGS